MAGGENGWASEAACGVPRDETVFAFAVNNQRGVPSIAEGLRLFPPDGWVASEFTHGNVEMFMKRPILILLWASVALTSCQTAHRAAVSTFRVIDAPHEYLRRKLEVDNGDTDRRTTRTTTTSAETNVPPANTTYSQPFPEQQAPPPERQVVAAPPPPPPQREVVVERTRQPEATPTPPPRVTSRSTTTTTSRETDTTTPRNAVADKGGLLYAKPVPGKPGYVFSPYDKNGGYVDVTGFAPGSKVKDPYSGKIFLVP